MRKLSLLTCAAAVWLVLSGCIELERRQVAIRTSVEDPLEIGVKGLSPAMWPGGLGGFSQDGQRSYYRVGKTDTLVSVAERFYGSRVYAQAILRANEDAIEGAKGLTRGMILVLPEVESNETYRSETPAGEDARP